MSPIGHGAVFKGFLDSVAPFFLSISPRRRTGIPFTAMFIDECRISGPQCPQQSVQKTNIRSQGQNQVSNQAQNQTQVQIRLRF